MRRLSFSSSLPAWWGLSIALALATGAILSRSTAVGAASIGALGAAVVLLRQSVSVPVGIGFAALPWLTIFDDLIPAQLRTFTAAAAALLLLAVVGPPKVRGFAAPVGAAVFVTLLICQSIYATTIDELIQACKDIVFPVMVLCVLSPRGEATLRESRRLLVGSGIAAMVAHLAIVAAGAGSTGTYYGIGERLGYAATIPHELALLAVIAAAGGVAVAKRAPVKALYFALGAVPAALTAVRSALLAVFVLLAMLVVKGRFRPATLVAIVGVVAVAFAAGASETITARFERQSSELSGGIQSLGSGRGLIWSTALSEWIDDSPVAWAFGSGLRAVSEFETNELAIAFVGHSDVVEIVVDLGVVGLAAAALMWFALLRRRSGRIVLVPILIYALINGAIEYVGPLSYGLALAASLSDPPPQQRIDDGRER